MSRAGTVMVVDDDPIVCEVISSLLESRGYRVSVRMQAIGTSAAILQEGPELVVLDVEMPGLTGDGLVRALARTPKNGFRMPDVILHSSLSAERLRRLASECNAIGVIQKGDARNFLMAFDAIIKRQR